jgi:hypothetical protein
MNSTIENKLRQIHDICLKHDDFGAAATIERALNEYDEDREHFWDVLSSDAFWGGAGSIADQCPTSSSKSISDEEVHKDRRRVWRALMEIAREMGTLGRVNERTKSWASPFRSWLDHGL